MIMKQCSSCNISKDDSEFYKDKSASDGLTSKCKECQKEYQRKRYQENRDEILSQQKQYYKQNRNERIEYQRENYQYQTGKIKECKFCEELFITSFQSRRRQLYCSKECKYYYGYYVTGRTKEWQINYDNQRRLEDPSYRLHKNMHASIWRAIKQNKAGRKWESLVGYTLDELMDHIEAQFKEGMTWDNYGEWHIDHIIPKSAFNYSKPEHLDFKRCWALDNLQPLWAKENLTKGDRIDEVFQPSFAM